MQLPLPARLLTEIAENLHSGSVKANSIRNIWLYVEICSSYTWDKERNRDIHHFPLNFLFLVQPPHFRIINLQNWLCRYGAEKFAGQAGVRRKYRRGIRVRLNRYFISASVSFRFIDSDTGIIPFCAIFSPTRSFK